MPEVLPTLFNSANTQYDTGKLKLLVIQLLEMLAEVIVLPLLLRHCTLSSIFDFSADGKLDSGSQK